MTPGKKKRMAFPYSFIPICIYTLQRYKNLPKSAKFAKSALETSVKDITMKQFQIQRLCTENQIVIWFKSAALPCMLWNNTSSQQLENLKLSLGS